MSTNHVRMKPDKTYLSLLLLSILTTVLWISSCTHNAKIADIPEVCFQRDVLPIFINNCAMTGCHDGGGESGMALNNYIDISNSVVPGNPNSSQLYQTIIDVWGANRMPPNQPLSLENRTLIRLWIEQGALETVCPAPVASGNGVEIAVNNGGLINH
ncbi:MAG: hypothetical protein EPN88_00280 [Bacteroidetes bacterium]|nr:MAG: hypothetical protein EPN88_00280 [Bacteroidota bacterium]